MQTTKKRCSRVTRAQKDLLVNFMAANVDFARGQFGGVNSHAKALEMWESLALQLNAMGPVVKTADQWKKCWTDLKASARKLKNERRRFMNKTGGGSITEATRDLNEMEETILRIITTHAVDGDSATPESGVAHLGNNSGTVQDDKENSESEPEQPSCPKQRKVGTSNYESALQEAHQIQKTFERRFEKLEAQNIEILASQSQIIAQNEANNALLKQILMQFNNFD